MAKSSGGSGRTARAENMFGKAEAINKQISLLYGKIAAPGVDNESIDRHVNELRVLRDRYVQRGLKTLGWRG